MKRSLLIVLALLALASMNLLAWAQEVPGPSVTLNGLIVTDLGYRNLGKELTTNKKDDVTSAFINLGNTSYLRANFTSADKTTGAMVQLSVMSKSGGAESTSLHYAYGWWKLGNCRLYAGHTDNWLGSNAFAPRQMLGQYESTKNQFINWGHIYGGRNPQVGFQWEAGAFGFQVALVQPGSEKLPSVASGQDLYATLPRADLALSFKAGGLLVQPGFGWSQLKTEGAPSGADTEFTSMIFILPVKFSAGPFTAKLEGYTGKNTDAEWSGNRLAALGSLNQSMPYIKSNYKVEDTSATGGMLSLEYKFMANWEIATGFGLVTLTNDAWKQKTSQGGAGWKEDNYTRSAWFVALPYAVTKNFTIHPELNFFNYGDNPKDGKDSGSEWMGGVEFRFAF